MKPPTCDVLLPDGTRCGYVAVGETVRDRIIDLHKHQHAAQPGHPEVRMKSVLRIVVEGVITVLAVWGLVVLVAAGVVIGMGL